LARLLPSEYLFIKSKLSLCGQERGFALGSSSTALDAAGVEGSLVAGKGSLEVARTELADVEILEAAGRDKARRLESALTLTGELSKTFPTESRGIEVDPVASPSNAERRRRKN
jgi:hypothetical protein